MYNASNVTYDSAIYFSETNRSSNMDMIVPICKYIDEKNCGIRKDGMILDVGANIGYFSLLLMEYINFVGTSHLFEPIDNLVLQGKRLYSDKRYNIHYHNYALGDHNGKEIIWVNTVNGNIGANTIVKDMIDIIDESHDVKHDNSIEIDVRRYDDLHIGVPDFIKIDVDGYECKVISGMLDMLTDAEKKPPILCEYGHGKKFTLREESSGVFGKLRELGYKSNMNLEYLNEHQEGVGFIDILFTVE